MSDIWRALTEADPLQSWWPFVVSAGVGIIMTIKTAMGGQMCPTQHKLDNQTVVVAIGDDDDEVPIEICRELCARDVECLVIGCKTVEKFEQFKSDQLKTHRNLRIDLRPLDFDSFPSVRSFVSSLQLDYRNIDILINCPIRNVEKAPATDDKEKIHRFTKVNYLAPFLLIVLVVRLLRNIRIVTVIAEHYVETKEPKRSEIFKKSLIHSITDKNQASINASYAWAICNKWLALKLKECKIFICTTGTVVPTNERFSNLLTFPLKWLLRKTPKQGAQVAIYVATETTLNNCSGELFNDCEKQSISSTTDSSAIDKIISETFAAVAVDANNWLK